jgi:hypothetical protein
VVLRLQDGDDTSDRIRDKWFSKFGACNICLSGGCCKGQVIAALLETLEFGGVAGDKCEQAQSELGCAAGRVRGKFEGGQHGKKTMVKDVAPKSHVASAKKWN